ncbi:hypothetical protein QTH90_05365 [Variovorax sp. J2P1-59]|uniref:hypothetical protein n=1 Tax=Variovorax flavidus TaxID=3053501 RepID=UPI002576FC4D|nr:hypothetical protein [Variovorax sp. J2P1-59]MDM0073798.1 hypothetical protein [Variovorax sp. J2P1-59]
MKFCEACHTPNKDRARYCLGCKGKFSGVRFAANTSASTFPDSLEAMSAPPVPTRKLDRAGRAPRAGKRIGLRVLLLLLVSLGAFAYWYSSHLAVGLSMFDKAISGFSSTSFTSRLASLWQSSASDEVAIVETPVQPVIPATVRPPVAAPAPAPVSRRRNDDSAPKPRSAERASDSANAFDAERKVQRAKPVEQVQPPLVIGSAFQAPAPVLAPPDAPAGAIPEPERAVTEPKEKECSEALAALALCPK